MVITMVRRPTTATPAGRQRLCSVQPPRCALSAMPAASRTMLQSTHAASSHANPSAGNAASTTGKTAQCRAQASDADMPARSKTATDFTSYCSTSLQCLIAISPQVTLYLSCRKVLMPRAIAGAMIADSIILQYHYQEVANEPLQHDVRRFCKISFHTLLYEPMRSGSSPSSPCNGRGKRL